MKSHSAEQFYFWEHLQRVAKVDIPLYQRDYVQGSNTDEAKLIRQEFIKDLISALRNKSAKDLHFVFGGSGSEKDFVPVDGQQRLTTLFLLHWYILARTGTTSEEEKKTLSKFHYASRDTSERFCEEFVNLLSCFNNSDYSENFFNGETIGNKIQDLPWFTGNISSDTTIRSMLVVLDEIHNQLNRCEPQPSKEDFVEYKNYLLSDVCSIKYLSLDMAEDLGGAQGVRDLYVKMNARGKLLTDFENFKAYLRKASTNNHDVVKNYLESKSLRDDIGERTQLLGKINNDFTNLFFNIIDDGLLNDSSVSEDATEKDTSKFDMGMMNYFSEIILTEFLIKIKGIFSNIKLGEELQGKSGKALYHFMNYGAYEFCEECIKSNKKLKDQNVNFTSEIECALTNGFSKAIGVLEVLTDKSEILTLLSKENYIATLLKDLGENRDSTTEMFVARYLILEYIYRFKEFSSARYIAFKELLERTLNNIEFEHKREGYNTIKEFKKILDKLDKDGSDEAELWEALTTTECEHTATEYHLSEEKVKASLLLENSSKWKQRFINAENIHPTKQIFYLLELSKNEVEEVDVDLFDKYFNLCKTIFATDGKNLVINGDAKNKMHFENSLLFSEKGNADDYYHLIQEKNRRKFSHLNYCRLLSKRFEAKNKIIFDLLIEMGRRDDLNNIFNSLEDIHSERKSRISPSDWRYLFADYDIYSLMISEEISENKDVSISRWEAEEGFSYYLLYRYGTQSNAKSIVLQLAHLALYLREKGLSVDIIPFAETYSNWEKPRSAVRHASKDITFFEGKFILDDNEFSNEEDVYSYLIKL